MAPPRADAAWPWPEARLRYANAVLPEAMIAAGAALDRQMLLQQGLDLLAWLLEHETLRPASVGHARRRFRTRRHPAGVRPAAHRSGRDRRRLCPRRSVDGDRRWVDGLGAAAAWFLGDNDGRHVMWDPDTGGGYDGLTPRGP